MMLSQIFLNGRQAQKKDNHFSGKIRKGEKGKAKKKKKRIKKTEKPEDLGHSVISKVWFLRVPEQKSMLSCCNRSEAPLQLVYCFFKKFLLSKQEHDQYVSICFV